MKTCAMQHTTYALTVVSEGLYSSAARFECSAAGQRPSHSLHHPAAATGRRSSGSQRTFCAASLPSCCATAFLSPSFWWGGARCGTWGAVVVVVARVCVSGLWRVIWDESGGME